MAKTFGLVRLLSRNDRIMRVGLGGTLLYALTIALVIPMVSNAATAPTAQIQMGDSWRIGIDEESKSTLVQHGLFGVSRNPIFLGMLIMLVGLLLLLPTAATLTVTVLGFVLIHVQVRLEEAFLTEKYGEDYRKYQMSVRRWI